MISKPSVLINNLDTLKKSFCRLRLSFLRRNAKFAILATGHFLFYLSALDITFVMTF